MYSLKCVKESLQYTLEHRMNNIDKLIAKIKPNDIHYKPCNDETSLTLGELLTHMYEMVFAYTKGTLKGTLTEKDLEEIPVPQTGASLDVVKNYISKVKAYFRTALEQLSDDLLQKEVTFECWGGISLKGYEALMTITEEIIHHRGQLTLYLRLTGVELPIAFIYDTS